MPTRRTGVEFNFDGLTDSVTNLVGSLILLVVLVLAVTSPKLAGVDQPPPPDNKAGAEKPVDLLLEKIRGMKTAAGQVEQEIQQMDARVVEIAGNLDELRQKSAELTGGI